MTDEITLWQLVRRWWWALLLSAAVAGIAGYAISTKLPKSYQSTATLLVGPINTDVALDASGSLTATYQSLATSQPTLQAAIAATHAKLTPTQLIAATTTTSNTVSRLVTISVSNSDPALAAALANAIGAHVSSLANTTPTATNAAINAFDQEPQVQALTPAQRQSVETALRAVVGVSPAGDVTAVNPAIPATSPASPKKSLVAILGALAGLIIAAIALFLRASSRGVAPDERSLSELEHTYLGVVDVSPTRDATGAVLVEARPRSSEAADYRMLATRISLVERAQSTRSLLVVDSTDGSAAAVVAANLAAALARTTDQAVMLADVSTEHGSATKLLGLQGREGYAELVAHSDLDALNGKLSDLFVDRGDLVRVLPRGRGEHSGPLSAQRARAVLRRLREHADLVVLSGPPVSRSASGLIWARAAESVLFVVDGTRTTQDDVVKAIDDLSLSNACFLGTVIGRRRAALFGRANAGIPRLEPRLGLRRS
jgi:tyrosine-protein kinase